MSHPSIIFVFDATVEPQVLVYRETFTGSDVDAYTRMVELSEQYGTGCQVDYVTWDYMVEYSSSPEADYSTWANTQVGESVDATWPRSAITPKDGKCGEHDTPVTTTPKQDDTPVTVTTATTVSTSGAVVRRSEATEPPSSEVSASSTSTSAVSPATISTVQVAGVQTSRSPLPATGSDPTGLFLLGSVLIALGAAAVRRARRIA